MISPESYSDSARIVKACVFSYFVMYLYPYMSNRSLKIISHRDSILKGSNFSQTFLLRFLFFFFSDLMGNFVFQSR